MVRIADQYAGEPPLRGGSFLGLWAGIRANHHSFSEGCFDAGTFRREGVRYHMLKGVASGFGCRGLLFLQRSSVDMRSHWAWLVLLLTVAGCASSKIPGGSAGGVPCQGEMIHEVLHFSGEALQIPVASGCPTLLRFEEPIGWFEKISGPSLDVRMAMFRSDVIQFTLLQEVADLDDTSVTVFMQDPDSLQIPVRIQPLPASAGLRMIHVSLKNSP